MREHPGVDRPRLRHFRAQRRIAIDPVDAEGTRIVKRHEHIRGRDIGRQMNRARG